MLFSIRQAAPAALNSINQAVESTNFDSLVASTNEHTSRRKLRQSLGELRGLFCEKGCRYLKIQAAPGLKFRHVRYRRSAAPNVALAGVPKVLSQIIGIDGLSNFAQG